MVRALNLGAPSRVWRIGFLSPADGVPTDLLRGLSELGYSVGRDIRFEWRSAQGQQDRLPALAGDLVSLGVDLIVTTDNLSIFAAKGATGTIPIVLTGATSPVEAGFVASLEHPGNNITG